MIRITDKTQCCGCSACYSACPHNAITMKPDALGFPYPYVDEEQCIDCGLCEKVCPCTAIYEGLSTENVFAAVNEDAAVRSSSSSGGVFPVAAGKVLDEGGKVYGAAFGHETMSVRHHGAETHEDCRRFSGSKYVQSDLGDCFRDVKRDLEDGRKVLFSGTPCQVAGLLSFVGKHRDGLNTFACACHGVPSPMVWKRYYDEVCGNSSAVTFRDKSEGWKNYKVRIGEYASPAFSDPYMKAMLKGYTLRPSCRECIFKGKDTGFDILSGDWWSIGRLVPEMDDDKGTSALVINTDTGKELMSDGGLRLLQMPALDDPGNGGFRRRVFDTFDQDKFAEDLSSCDSVYALLKSLTEATVMEKIVRRLKKLFKI